MRGIFTAAAAFSLGVAAGYIFACRKLTKDFDERMQDELKANLEDYINKKEPVEKEEKEEVEEVSYSNDEEPISINYSEMYQDKKSSFVVVNEEDSPPVDEMTFLTLYSDGVLVDDSIDEPVLPNKTIGFRILRNIKDDETIVHNLIRDIYYVVVKSDIPYSSEEPPNIEEGGDEED